MPNIKVTKTGVQILITLFVLSTSKTFLSSQENQDISSPWMVFKHRYIRCRAQCSQVLSFSKVQSSWSQEKLQVASLTTWYNLEKITWGRGRAQSSGLWLEHLPCFVYRCHVFYTLARASQSALSAFRMKIYFSSEFEDPGTLSTEWLWRYYWYLVSLVAICYIFLEMYVHVLIEQSHLFIIRNGYKKPKKWNYKCNREFKKS